MTTAQSDLLSHGLNQPRRCGALLGLFFGLFPG